MEERDSFARAGPERNSPKRLIYNTPRLTIHGDVERITRQGGFSATDVPIGTPVGPGGITSVAS